jgi:uncharacterized protein YjbI with pentapeptide repeats
MITPQRAIVRPRAISPTSGDSLPLDEIVSDLLASGCRAIQIAGGPGAGKSTALKHLAAVLPADDLPKLVDDPTEEEALVWVRMGPTIFASRKLVNDASITVVSLAAWTNDDLVEYLLAAHPDRCKTVMLRLNQTSDKPDLRGNPTVWRIVLDQMVANEALRTVSAAVEQAVGGLFATADDRRLAGMWSLAILTHDENTALRTLKQLASRHEDFERIRMLRHSYVQRLLAAEHIAQCLARPGECGPLGLRLPQPLIEEVAKRIKQEGQLFERLFQIVETENPRFHAMAASILHAAGSAWRPCEPGVYCLRGGYFHGASWPGARLGFSEDRRSDLIDADLTEADLTGVQANHALLNGARLVRAKLRQASLILARGVATDFSDADLTQASAAEINLQRATLNRAVFDSAILGNANLQQASMRGTSFRDANLTGAVLLGSNIEDADFSGATLCRAKLAKLPLRLATLIGASFEEADLSECDLEGIRLLDADFYRANLRNAWLTASILLRADFRKASLRGAGLADIHWENADLREADLRSCTFHMGSTRSGLVDSPYPGHGSKTGFYTDDYYDQGYKRPEEIRKANLCGADLRGAKLVGVDFYLVDLRGAKFDPDAAEYLQKCGAILVER